MARKPKAAAAAAVRSLKIEYRDPASLAAYDRNARVHTPAQVRQIAQAMREFGWTNPMLVDESGGIVAGHGRLAAAQSIWAKGEDIAGCPGGQVPGLVVPGLTPERRAALVLLDNRIALNAAWNEEILASELRLLQDDGWSLTDLGFGLEEIAALLAETTAGHTDPDDAPPAPDAAATVARAGDVWVCGPHRVVCGDCTVPQTVEAALRGYKPRLMVTDPPYGVEYDPAWRQAAGIGSAGAAVGKVLNDDRADWRAAWALFPGAVAYVWHGGLHAATVAASLEAVGLRVRAQIVWVKTRPAISRGAYHWQHEPAFYATVDGEADGWRFIPEHEVSAYAVREGDRADWRGGRKQSTVWQIEHLKSDTGHGTQKPVECMRRPIENNSGPGEVVYDPFLGSGTTLIAATQAGRVCVGCELNPSYVDVIVRRWQDFTRQSAVLEGDGRSFEAVGKERLEQGDGRQDTAGGAPDGAARGTGRRTAQGPKAKRKAEGG
jgi:DNA modification methylase